MEWQIVFDGGGGLDGLYFEGGADICQGTGPEGQRLGMICLPSLIFRPQIECP